MTGVGTVYALASANDVNLPASFIVDGTTTEVLKGALTLAADSSYIFSIALRTSVNGGQLNKSVSTLRGAFRRNGAALALVLQSDTSFVGTYTPNLVTLQRGKAQVAGDRFVFAR